MLTRMPAAWRRFTVGAKLAPMRDQIEAALGRDLLAFLRDQADFVGHDPEGEVENLGRVAHLEIELGHDVLAKPLEIASLHVPAIRAQMRGDAVRAGALANARDGNRIRLGIFRFRHAGITRLPQGGDMVDINAQMQCAHRRSIGANTEA